MHWELKRSDSLLHAQGQIDEAVLLGASGLVQLSLADNTFTGPIPSSVSYLVELRTLKLGTNQFTGSQV